MKKFEHPHICVIRKKFIFIWIRRTLSHIFQCETIYYKLMDYGVFEEVDEEKFIKYDNTYAEYIVYVFMYECAYIWNWFNSIWCIFHSSLSIYTHPHASCIDLKGFIHKHYYFIFGLFFINFEYCRTKRNLYNNKIVIICKTNKFMCTLTCVLGCYVHYIHTFMNLLFYHREKNVRKLICKNCLWIIYMLTFSHFHYVIDAMPRRRENTFILFNLGKYAGKYCLFLIHMFYQLW